MKAAGEHTHTHTQRSRGEQTQAQQHVSSQQQRTRRPARPPARTLHMAEGNESSGGRRSRQLHRAGQDRTGQRQERKPGQDGADVKCEVQ